MPVFIYGGSAPKPPCSRSLSLALRRGAAPPTLAALAPPPSYSRRGREEDRVTGGEPPARADRGRRDRALLRALDPHRLHGADLPPALTAGGHRHPGDRARRSDPGCDRPRSIRLPDRGS